jgi:cytochrome P450
MTQEMGKSAGPARMFGPEMLANPYPAYNLLRSMDPVHWQEAVNGWVLSRYADVAAMLRGPHVSSDRTAAQAKAPEEFRELYTFRANSMLNSDPPKHTRLRTLVSKAFTPAAVERLAPIIQKVVDEAVDAALPAGGMEIMHDLAYPLPVTVIAHMLGVPPEDRDRFKKWSDEITATAGNIVANLTPEHYRRAIQSTRELTAYFRQVVAERRSRPRDDLLTAMAKAEEQGDRLSEPELFANAVLLLNAGHETTTNLIGNGAWALLRFPEQKRRLREDPSLANTAVEELLRFDSPVQFTSRALKEDVTVGGKALKAGQMVLLLLGAANRDPAQFADPDRLDVGRQDNKHVAFGMGPHFCLGAPLARLEGRIVLQTLLRRLPGLRLDGPEPAYRDNFNLRGLKALKVAF